jgi:hypothetical protein
MALRRKKDDLIRDRFWVQRAINDVNEGLDFESLSYSIYKEGDKNIFEVIHTPNSFMNFIRTFLEFLPKSKVLGRAEITHTELRCIELGINLLDSRAVNEVGLELAFPEEDSSVDLELIAERSRYRMFYLKEAPTQGNMNLVTQLQDEGYHFIAEQVKSSIPKLRLISNAFSN